MAALGAGRVVGAAGVITRRGFLGGGAALAGAAALQACGLLRSGPPAVRFSNWPYYIDEKHATLKSFTKATGIPVEYREDINDNEEFFAKIREPLSRKRSIGRDIIVLTDSTAARLVRLGWVEELDRSAIPNAANLIDALARPAFDPERRFTLPWVSGITGLAYNRDRTGRDLRSVNDILDKAFAGHVTMLSEMEDTLGLMMLGEGVDPAQATDDDMALAAERVRSARDSGQIRRFTGDDYGDDLVRGDVWVAFAWSGDVIQLQKDNPALRFLVPDEGGMIWSDNMMIPKGAEQKAGAESLMNYVYDPAVSAKLIAELQFVSPVNGVQPLLPAELATSQLIVPNAQTRSRLRSFRALDDATERRFKELFQSIVRG